MWLNAVVRWSSGISHIKQAQQNLNITIECVFLCVVSQLFHYISHGFMNKFDIKMLQPDGR